MNTPPILSDTPTTANVGTHRQIRISVRDGQDSVSLPAFDLAVAAHTGTATLSGHAPTERPGERQVLHRQQDHPVIIQLIVQVTAPGAVPASATRTRSKRSR